MRLVESNIGISTLKEFAEHYGFGFVKAVVDIETETIMVDADLHADIEQELLKLNHQQENLWGINLYPDTNGDDFIEYDSLINIRPRQNNPSRNILDDNIRKRIAEVVAKRVKRDE